MPAKDAAMSLLRLSLVLHILTHLHMPAAAEILGQMCESGNYTAGGAFQSNLNLLLSNLTLTSTKATFSTATEGSAPDRIYGLFLCRGDINTSTCHNCTKTATREVLQLCPSSKQATVWYTACQIRYSDVSFFSSVEDSNFFHYWPEGEINTTDPSRVMYEKELIGNLSYRAAYMSPIMFAVGKIVYKRDQPAIYGMAQCTRDLKRDGCYQCLQYLVDGYMRCCQNRRVFARVMSYSCNFRNDGEKIFDGEPDVSLDLVAPQLPPSTVPAKEKGNEKSIIVLKTTIPIAATVVLIFAIYISIRRRSRKKFSSLAKLEKISSVESLFLDLSMIEAATDNFSPANKLGEGGFGSVYKGVLPDGQEIAVKRLSATSKQGMGELTNELILVAKLQHKNLVRLHGVCLQKQEKLLVYEYVTNRSLDTFLFDPIQKKKLSWERRFQIITGISQGLHYLHEESRITVIHRDLKASNILLDANMNPKISDFGLSRLFGSEEKECITKRVVGTLGYMAPEYVKRGQFSVKSDVYSFGVLLIEIVTGRKRNRFHDSENYRDLLSYAWEHWTNGTALETVDPSLEDNFSENEVLICIQIALLCTQEIPTDRPLMLSVLLMLNGSSVALPPPSRVTFNAGTSTPNCKSSGKRSDLACELVPISGSDASMSELQPR